MVIQIKFDPINKNDLIILRKSLEKLKKIDVFGNNPRILAAPIQPD
jgi:hypothetical protein